MFEVAEPQKIHSVKYRSSGSKAPRELSVDIVTVRYRTRLTSPPTFLATADLQGREIPSENRLVGELVVDEIRILQEMNSLPAIDLCLLCGDFFDYPDLRKLGGTGDVTSALNAFASIANQTFVVLGNHDEVTSTDLDPKVTVLDGNVVRSNGFTIGGVSGIIGDPKRNNRKTESEFLKSVTQCSTSRVQILMLHQGPEGPTDRHRGWAGLNKALKTRSNLLVLFGHCHWPDAFHANAQNLFCNIDARIIVFIPDQVG